MAYWQLAYEYWETLEPDRVRVDDDDAYFWFNGEWQLANQAGNLQKALKLYLASHNWEVIMDDNMTLVGSQEDGWGVAMTFQCEDEPEALLTAYIHLLRHIHDSHKDD